MRVLVVFHGASVDGDGPSAGGALRAATHGRALTAAGHTVKLLSRVQDGPGGYRSPRDLTRLAAAFEPDWILCVAPTEAPALAPVAPLVVDLYAPRMLEAAWEGTQEIEADRALRAIHAADEVLVSNPRQRWWWAGILGLCGWELTEAPGLLVPLTATEDAPPRAATAGHPEGPRLILGGFPWPWQDPDAAIAEALDALGGRGELVTVGLPPRPGVRCLPALPRAAWLAELSTADAALDRYAPHLERQMALSFRQMDYLAAGLPLCTDPDNVLGPEVTELGAGWTGSIHEAVDVLRKMRKNARLREQSAAGVARLAARYRLALTHAPLLAWSPRRRPRRFSVVGAARERAALRERLGRLDRRAEAWQAELQAKRAELTTAHDQIAALTASIERMSAAMLDVAGFRREAVAVLGTRLSDEHNEAEFLRRELEILRADLHKKDQERFRLQAERDRLGGVLARLRR